MMALHMKNREASYYQSAPFCRHFSFTDTGHYLARFPAGPESVMKPPLALFSAPQQPFHHMEALHQLGPPPMAPAQPLGPPPMIPAPALGPPTLMSGQALGPPPMASVHTLRPPLIAQVHNMGPPPMGLPPMAHALVHPPMDHMHVLRTPPLDLSQTMGPPPGSPAHALGPPLLGAPRGARFTLPPGPMSSPPPPAPPPSQPPPRLHGPPPCLPPLPALVPCPLPGRPPPPGPLPGHAAPAGEYLQEEGSPLGVDDPDGGLEELCKPLYCKLCNVTLNSAQQAHAHYQGKNHSKKLRNFYAGSQQPPGARVLEVLESGGPAPLSAGPGDGDTGRQPLYKGATRVILATENDYCKLCDASFSSLAVAQAHYHGKNHAKKLRLAEAQQNSSNTDGSEVPPRRHRKDSSEYRLMKTRRLAQVLPLVPGPYYNPRPRLRIPRDLAMCVTPSGQFYCSMCNSGAEQENEFRLHLESKQHKAKVSELRYRNEMENLGYS
ncbi:zinc finger matrin-type protein 3 [Gadus chalcogrammus]|uniref:zinc finger matrin-type protein 3 n=1 Tax=Gadus chalcogrammus TaxID=1042646 RepID=UPI0024C4AAA6|nr:zinc finger matrin-type protein 3 [Gadus chalcogrammus]